MNKTIAMLTIVSAALAAAAGAVPAFAQTASTGAFANPNHATATGSASSTGPSGSSAGTIAVCPDFATFRGSCSESA
jgi:hypothetical protein